ncbi:MAG TPA: heme-degrading domain-containing protein [Steroidobacteraceae bacterium]|nr:heme-degrading domain-containing protein [Steroidobacteraceae bacterium]
MSLEQDLAAIATQEARLQFEKFDAAAAWRLGSRLREAAMARAAAVTLDIWLGAQQLFFNAMPGTTPDNAEWARRKRNVVLRFHRSSYAVGLELARRQTTLREKYGLEERDHAAHGGCFPLLLRGTGCVGTIAVSGLPQREDHELIVAVLASELDVPGPQVALPPP